MPIAKVKLPDGRVAKFNVQEGTTPEQVMAFANKQFGQSQEPGYLEQGRQENIEGLQQGLNTRGEPAPASPELLAEIENMNGLERVLVGMGKGFTDIGQGVKQIGLQAGERIGVVPEGRADEYTRQIQEENQMYDQPLLDRSMGARIGRFAGNVAATAPVSLPFGGAPATIPAAMAQGAGIGAASAGLMPTSEGESRLGNMAIGGTLGAVTGGAVKGSGRLYGGLRGNESARLSQDLMSQSKNFDVPLTVGELRGNPTLQRIEQTLERVPGVGTAGFRAKQAESLNRAASTLVRRYAGDGIEDVGEELQGSLARTLATNRKVASEIFDELGDEAAKSGNKVSLNNVKGVVAEITSREGQLPSAIQNSDILASLNKYGSLEDLPFDVARRVRSRLGQEMRRAEKQAIGGSVTDEEGAALKMIYSAVEDDIASFAAKEGGAIGDLYQKANSFYRSKVVPFKDRSLRKVGTDIFDTDQIVNMFIKNDRPKLAFKLMSNLDPNGKAAVKYAVLQDAFDVATGGTNKTAFSPAKFAARLEKLGSSKNAIFEAAERKQLDGFVKLARAAERAGQFAENPPTGQRWVDASIMGGAIGGAVVNPAAVASAGSMSLVLSKMLTTDFGRKVLTRAAGLPEKSPVWRRIVYQDVPRALAIAGEAGQDKLKRRQQPNQAP